MRSCLQHTEYISVLEAPTIRCSLNLSASISIRASEYVKGMARDRSRSRDRYRNDRSSRKRSRSRSRDRRKSRSRSRDRRGWSEPDPNSAVAQMQALAAVQAQAQLQRQLLAQQQPLLSSVSAVNPLTLVAAATAAAGTAAAGVAVPVNDTQARKSREIYIGNLNIGTVTIEMLTELFNAAMAGMVPDPVTNPPVVNVKMDATGRFAFVEFRTEELATTAMSLDKTELCGRAMNIGRPKGYVPGTSTAGVANDTLAAAQQVAAALLGGVTPVVLLENLLSAAAIHNADERQEVSEMVYEEAMRCGKVLGIAVPVPPLELAVTEGCRVYVKFSSSAEAAKCKEMMDGRLFDDNKVKATHVTEADYNRAAAGDWIMTGAAASQASANSLGVPSIPPGFGYGPTSSAMPTLMPGVPYTGPPSVAGLSGAAPGTMPGLEATIPGLAARGIPGLGAMMGVFPPPP